jgi:hypothetical protein
MKRTLAVVFVVALMVGCVAAKKKPPAPGSAIGTGTRNRPVIMGLNEAVTVIATLTRPANTTQYTAGDEITDTGGAVLEVTGCAQDFGGSGRIKQIDIIDSVNAATDPDPDVFIYDTTSTPQADNAAFAPADGVTETALYAADMGNAIDSGANNIIFVKTGLDIPYVCGGASKSLFVRLVERSTYTPASGETFKVRLHIVRDGGGS